MSLNAFFFWLMFFDFTWEERCQHRKALSIMTIELAVQKTFNVNGAKTRETNALFLTHAQNFEVDCSMCVS